MDTQQNKKEQDISLQAPGEANREKHINFLEKEEMDMDITDADNAGDANFTPVYLDEDNTLQTPDEKRHDEQVHPGKNEKVEPSEDDLDETLFDRLNSGDQNTSTKV